MTHRNRRPESARTRPNSDTPTRIARHKATIARGNVQTSFPNLATERFPPTFAIPSPGFFPTFFRRENPRARARSSPPPANATAALYPSRDLRTRTKTNDDERRRVKQKRYSQVRRHPRVTSSSSMSCVVCPSPLERRRKHECII